MQLLLFINSFASIDKVVSRLTIFSIKLGNDFIECIKPSSCSLFIIFLDTPIEPHNKSNETSWVRKAFVDATPISAPAFVKKEKLDSLTSDEPSTLHIDKDARYPCFFDNLNASNVSAVSPDWDKVTNKLFFGVTDFLYLYSEAISTLHETPANSSNQ